MDLGPVDFRAFIRNRLRLSHDERPAPEPPPVLVVDDEESVRNYVAKVLARTGLAPVLACDGPDALAKTATLARCPVLLTDLMMPGMSGDELARHLRQQEPDIKVLYLTGFADRLFVERAMLWEGEAFLEKPFTPTALIEALALLLTGHPAASALAPAAVAPLT